jgi:hypothetical protein
VGGREGGREGGRGGGYFQKSIGQEEDYFEEGRDIFKRA